MTASFLEKSGLLRDGATMQAGAGGTSLAIAVFVHQMLRKKGWKLSFGFGGSTKYMVDMLEEGQMGYILDAQAFDLDSVKSIEKNLNHYSIPGIQRIQLSLEGEPDYHDGHHDPGCHRD
jgi:citrate lyase subunit alpha/citrate CoA-transferase